MKKRLLTGDRPTGKLHLGHYTGSLRNRVQLQDEYESFIMVADVQALTDNFSHPEKVRESVYEVVLDNLAVGVDPDKVTFFIQSQIPEIAELTVFFSNLVTVSQLERNPTVKEEIASKGSIFKDGNVTFGFLGYPVSQAADILFCKAELVPVGEDQLPMIEQTREIAKKFNKYYGEVFPLPKPLLSKIGRLKGLDGRKMSKSFDNAIYLSDSREEIARKVMPAKTDNENSIIFDPENRPDISNLILYYQIATGAAIKDIEKEFAGVESYKLFKEKLVDVLDKFLEPIRKRRAAYAADMNAIQDILEKGKVRASEEAQKTMELVRKAMKLDY
ncbi:MAG: tryptophan--tRNA ligase [bacterium]|nr:tryptophan--tRNA ligase [bacterium]